MMKKTINGLLTFCFGAGLMMSSAVSYAEGKKVLYVTHEPGRWHKYTPQLEIFKEIGKKAGWDVTVMTGEHDAQIKKLQTLDFGKGYDAIVYNFCFASSDDLVAANNIMLQTREHGVPAVLVHCAMHSWWPTYRDGKEGALGPEYKGKAKAKPELFEKWKKEHPGKFFPAWGDFTGVASGRHGPQKPIKLTKVKDHPITARVKDGSMTGPTELYNNIYKVDGVEPLLEGTQGDAKATVLWLCPQGKSKVLGFSIGHGVADWKLDVFQNTLTDGVNYLIANPSSASKAE